MPTIRSRLTRDGTRRYQAIIRLANAPTIYQTFTNKSAATRWAKRIEAEIRAGHLLPRLEGEKHTLAEALERYRKNHLPELSPADQVNRTAHLAFWRERLGRYTVGSITPAQIIDARASIKRAPATANRYVATLSAVFDRAWREWQWVLENPCRKVRRLREPRGRVRYLDDDERRRLLAACRSSRARRLFPLVLFALATGARRQELLSLKWKDVDVARRCAVLHKTKNRQRRMLHFAGEAGRVLAELPRSVSGYVFEPPRFPRQAWEAAVEAAELVDFRFHDLRHTFASYAAMAGASLAEIAALLGHKSLASTQRYAHLEESHQSRVVERVAERLG